MHVFTHTVPVQKNVTCSYIFAFGTCVFSGSQNFSSLRVLFP